MNQQNSPTDTVAHDAACVRCGYNLRGLPLDGNCPECGTVVAGSLGRERLHYCDPAWRTALLRGYDLLSTVFLLQGLASLASLVLMVVALGGVKPQYFERVIPESLLGLGCLWLPTLCIGAVLISTPDPARRHLREGFSPRRRTRVVAATIPLTGAALLFHFLIWPLPGSFVIWYVVAIAAPPIQLAALLIGVIDVTRDVVRRVDPRQARLTADYGKLLAVTAAACWFLGLGSATFWFTGGVIGLLGFGLPTSMLFAALTMLAGIDRAWRLLGPADATA